MDRDELQDRIRQRRAPGDPYRRGGFAGDAPAGYERFEPDPQDAAAMRPEAGGAEGEPRFDYFEDRAQSEPPPVFGSPQPPPDITHEPEPDRWEPRPSPRPEWDTPAPPPPAVADAEERSAWAARPSDEPAYVPPQYAPEYEDAYDTDDEGYAYDEGRWRPPERRGPSAGGLAILGFLALGVLALLGGAVLAGVFSDGDGVATEPTPTPVVTVAPTQDASAGPTVSGAASASAQPSGSPGSAEGPVTFPDGAIFDVEPCPTQSMDFGGCAEDGTTIDGDTVYAWIGFNGATGDDNLLIVLRLDGTGVGDAEFDLGGPPFGCTSSCGGYARQGFQGLTPGTYELELTRNGEFADRASFTIEG
jgi:hypothetical protein